MPVNRVLLTFLLDVLQTLDHLTKDFQLINSSIVHCLANFKAEYTSEHIASLLADGTTEPVWSQPLSKRQRRLPGYLTNSVVTTRLPQYRDSDTISEFRALIVDIIKGFKSELDGRFSSRNVGNWDSFESLSPQEQVPRPTALRQVVGLCHECSCSQVTFWRRQAWEQCHRSKA